MREPAVLSQTTDGAPSLDTASSGRPVRRLDPHNARHRYFGALIAIGLLYVVAYGWLLASTDSLPYAIDNNESFSAYLHGASLYSFGLGTSFGLTDEAFSPDASAHPYVYTHGGNFPRVYTYILYALGARTPQAQILIATFSIGALGLFFVYVYFARLAGVAFAALTCLVFGTDYLFFAQWQVNSYRVWHTFLLFAALLCVHGVGGRRPRLFLGLLFLTEACLVYFDLTFAVFVSVFAAVYAAVLYRRRLRLMLGVWAAQFVAAGATLALLLVQSIAFLGWGAFVYDLAQTYGSRNSPLDGTSAGDRLIAELQDFYASHHVVFWHQLGTNQPLRDVVYFLRELVTFTLLPMTPLLSLVVLVICAGWLLAMFRPPPLAGPGWFVQARWTDSRRTKAWTHAGMLGLAAFAAALTLILGWATPGQGAPATGTSGLLLGSVLAACAAGLTTLLVTRFTTGAWLDFAALPVGRVALAALLLVVTAFFVWNSASLYDGEYAALARLGAWLPAPAATSVALIALAVATGLVLCGQVTFGGRPLIAYLTCGFIAYLACYIVLPGYVISDYLQRTAPLTVYGRDVLVALAIAVLVTLIGRAFRGLANARALRGFALAGAVGGLVVLCGYWINLQSEYLQLLPPTHYSAFLSLLSEPPFRGASFATNVYPAPVAAQTGQWAYTDQALGRGQVDGQADGYVVARDPTYLWLADATTNPAYLDPDYYLCVIEQNLSTTVRRLDGIAQGGCGQLGVVRLAGKDVPFPHDAVVATDDSGRDGWTIVRLDWNYPPYLAPLPASPDQPTDTYIRPDITHDATGWSVKPIYNAVQQSGQLQQPPQLRLFVVGNTTCLLSTTSDPSGFILPASFSSLVVMSVTPRTASAVGAEMFSQPFFVGAASYLLPNTQTGGYQHIEATSLYAAEQVATEARTWVPGAGAGLSLFTLPDVDSGNAQQVLAHSLEEAEDLASAAGTWNQSAGTYGVTSSGITLSKHFESCSS
ncbi:MAG: hypothetical protein JO057_13665 [Chloroflexi bacterium]|nr:hypothetical protein [Chloroflexota bacterium]